MTYEQALNKAAALCSQAEKCTSDIREKALGWGLGEDDVERLIDYLVAERYLDDSRYCRAYVNDKFRFQKWGRMKLRFTLRGKGIDDSAISMALEDAIDEEAYLETCRELVEAKMKGMARPLSPNDRARVYRFASQRGFETGVIGKALALCRESEDV